MEGDDRQTAGSDLGEAPGALDLDVLALDARRVLRGGAEDVLPVLVRLGGAPGGTRPKELVARAPDGTFVSGVSVESAKGPPWFAIRRFDRVGGERLHVHTLSGLLHADHRLPSLDYDHLLRITLNLTGDHPQVVQAWRRACFNVLAHNRDDHGKQFGFTMSRQGTWRLALAYDLTFAEGPGGEHSTTVEGQGAAPGRPHLLALARRYGIRDAAEVLSQVEACVAQWTHFADESGVVTESRRRVEEGLARVRRSWGGD